MQLPLWADMDGYVNRMDAQGVGLVSLHLGGGRATKESVIDPAVGVVLVKKPGDEKLEKFAPFTAPYGPIEGKNAFYLCENGACSLPVAE